jgi:glycosyltransferase involved in cell wall biosynthesis
VTARTAASAPHRFILNGKFLRAPMTGVHRVAAELARGLADLAAEAHPAVAGMAFELWHPHDAKAPEALGLPTRALGPLTSIPWEQLTFPLRKGRSTLLNLCNIGPALSRDAVTMIHDTQVHQSPQSYSPAFRLWYRGVQPVLGRRNRLILTVSEFSRQQIFAAGLAPLERIAVIHNGVDHVLRDRADTEILARLGVAPRGYALALSTTQAHKNIGVLLRAFATPALQKLPLVLFGGDDRTAFEAAGHAVPANVIFAGRVSNAELRTLYAEALCLAFPSTTEGFGLPPLEAMRLGCPAVVAPCGALPEVCGPAASYAAPDDPAAWAAAIARFIEDPALRAEAGASATAHAAPWTWNRSALALADALRPLARRA